MRRNSTSRDGKTSKRNGLEQEVLWMRAAMEAETLNELKFRALLRLLSRWSDAQLLALASAIFPSQTFAGRAVALKALETVHRRRTVALLLELEDVLAL